MPFLPKLKELKDKRGMTNQDIAELSQIPLATVNRILSGQTPNPTFESVAEIVIALNGSLDELVGIRSPDEIPVPTMTERAIDGYQQLLDEKDKRLAEKDDTIMTYKEAVKNLRKEKTRILSFIGGFSGLVLVTLVTILLVDAFNGAWGYFRY